MDYLDKLENDSMFIIREAYSRVKNMAMLWSIGKDSTTLLWLVRKAFLGDIPIPVIHIDTGYKFKEIYEFRDRYSTEWGFNLVVHHNKVAADCGVSPERGKLECCTELKTNALKQLIRERNFEALLLGIRRDEHGIRAKERVFSLRNSSFEWNYKHQSPEMWDQYKTETNQSEHIRIHPLLNWTEKDIWNYIEREQLPMVDLYFAKQGKRYRSIGCETCCQPVASEAGTVLEIIKELETTNISERSGRAQDKESAYVMQKLRSLGYM